MMRHGYNLNGEVFYLWYSTKKLGREPTLKAQTRLNQRNGPWLGVHTTVGYLRRQSRQPGLMLGLETESNCTRLERRIWEYVLWNRMVSRYPR
jgi:hypothetical protein